MALNNLNSVELIQKELTDVGSTLTTIETVITDKMPAPHPKSILPFLNTRKGLAGQKKQPFYRETNQLKTG
ncbi:MAG: hypothetical protein COA57_06585 [Flavobacteriales bacterium]|nr:hypothetical protein [Bacteroidales bacterium AH-315-I05]PCJ86180.1 MAG: hypothetical protein COA57_06585 [Flavobacteriales bacterium]